MNLDRGQETLIRNNGWSRVRPTSPESGFSGQIWTLCLTVAELDEILIGNRLSPSGCGHLGSEEKIGVKLGNLNCSLSWLISQENSILSSDQKFQFNFLPLDRFLWAYGESDPR